MPGSWPPSPTDTTFNAMPFAPEDDDDIPALELADDLPVYLATPVQGTPLTGNCGNHQLPLLPLPSNFVPAQTQFLGMMQSSAPDPDTTKTSETAQDAHTNPDAASFPPVALPPPSSFLALLQAAIASGPPQEFIVAIGFPQTPAHGLPLSVDDASDEQDKMPPLEEAVPSMGLAHPYLHPPTIPGAPMFIPAGTSNFGSVLHLPATKTPSTEGASGALGTAIQATWNEGLETTLASSMQASASGISPAALLTPLQVSTQIVAAFNSLAFTEAGPFGPANWSPLPRRHPFDAAEYVETLEEVDISTIPAEDMRCPHCWLPFGTTEETDPAFAMMIDPDVCPEAKERRNTFRELPYDDNGPSNDPVRTPCGHIFGRGCLIESLEKVNTSCPTCRRELNSMPGGTNSGSV